MGLNFHWRHTKLELKILLKIYRVTAEKFSDWSFGTNKFIISSTKCTNSKGKNECESLWFYKNTNFKHLHVTI